MNTYHNRHTQNEHLPSQIGHARTSTVDQNLDAQIQVLTSAERVADGRGFKFPADNIAMYLQCSHP